MSITGVHTIYQIIIILLNSKCISLVKSGTLKNISISFVIYAFCNKHKLWRKPVCVELFAKTNIMIWCGPSSNRDIMLLWNLIHRLLSHSSNLFFSFLDSDSSADSDRDTLCDRVKGLFIFFLFSVKTRNSSHFSMLTTNC